MSIHKLAIATTLLVAGLSFGCVLTCVRDERPKDAAWAVLLMMLNLGCAALLSAP